MKAEDRLVERIRRELVRPSPFVRVGIGDDAAVLAALQGDVAATTDVLVEGVDFFAGEAPETIGRRAVAVSLSDLAAIGARPRWFLLTVGFRPGLGEDHVFAICRGAALRGREGGAELCGGDLSGSPVLFVSVALAGELESRPLTRSGARAGEVLFLTGATGRAAAGLAIVRDGPPAGLPEEDVRELVAAYRDPRPPVELGPQLAKEGVASAAIDVSDGLGVDAGRLARASGVRAVLEAERLPIAPSLSRWAEATSRDPFALAVAGGDDYEILFAAPAETASAIEASTGAARVGFLEPGSGAVLRTASGDADVTREGWDHLEAVR